MAGDQRIGTELAGYRIESVLGRGGMSVVYLVEQSFPRRKVALKILAPELSSDPVFRERFGQESEAAASLEHPNIIPIYSAGEADGVLYIAMRYIEGADLKALILREGPLEPGRAVSIITQVASALDAAHHRGLIHRDVKPGNVLVASGEGPEATDHAYLSDFGLIRRHDQRSGITKTGQFMGTVDYVAPEQIEGKAVDSRADIYSLGAVAYECLTGNPPFHRDNDAALLYAHLNEPPPKPSSTRPELPNEVDQVVARAMAKRPDDRFGTAGELAAALRLALPQAAKTSPRPAVRGRRRRPAMLVAIAGTLAAVVALVVVLTGHGGRSPKVAPTGSASASSSPPSASGGPPPESLVRIDPGRRTIHVTAPRIAGLRIPLGHHLRTGFGIGLAIGEGGVWACVISDLVRVDPTSGTAAAPIFFGNSLVGPDVVVVGFRSVWALEPAGVDQIDPATDQIVGSVELGPFNISTSPSGLALGAGSVWMSTADGKLVRINPATLKRTVIPVGGSPSGLAFGRGSLWILDKFAGTVTRFDPATGKLGRPVGVSGSLDLIASGPGGLWVLDELAGQVTQLDPRTGAPGVSIRVGAQSTGIAVGLGAVWVTDLDGRVYRIDPVTQARTSIPVGTPLGAVVVDPAAGHLWVLTIS